MLPKLTSLPKSVNTAYTTYTACTLCNHYTIYTNFVNKTDYTDYIDYIDYLNYSYRSQSFRAKSPALSERAESFIAPSAVRAWAARACCNQAGLSKIAMI